MKKAIILLYGAAAGIILASGANARTCDSVYSIYCPVMAGSPSCCRASGETCIQAGCSNTTQEPIDPPIEFNKCPSECPSILWQDVSGQNYQTKCKDNTTCEYQCKAGYYGTNTSCNACPGNGTSAIGSQLIHSCYLPDGTSGSDTTGSWTIEGGKCYYSQIIHI
ncbi:MAG: hypothetical protein K2I81_00190 [Alphaproteobacteria bacterium]|nr:hypothetical protein [Alphaproteobacteria bacterium]